MNGPGTDQRTAVSDPITGQTRLSSPAGPVGDSFVARALAQTLEGLFDDRRRARGRELACQGGVHDLRVGPDGTISARVLEPTRCELKLILPKFSADLQRRILDALTQSPELADQLAGGEVPRELDALIRSLSAGRIGLLPYREPVRYACSCTPGGGDRCEHLAALCYLLAESLDQDQLQIFVIRGMNPRKLRPQSSERPPGSGSAANAAEFWSAPALGRVTTPIRTVEEILSRLPEPPPQIAAEAAVARETLRAVLDQVERTLSEER